MTGEHLHNGVQLALNVEEHLWVQWTRFGKEVDHVTNDRVLLQDGDLWDHQWNGDQVGGILNRLPDRSMVRMVVVCTMRNDKVRAESTNLGDDPLPNLQGWLQLAVGEVPDFITGADDRTRRLRSPLDGKLRWFELMVAGGTV